MVALTRREKFGIAAVFAAVLADATMGCNRHDAEKERAALHDAFIVAGVIDEDEKKKIFKSIHDNTSCSDFLDSRACQRVKDFYHSRLGR
jgi:hypothetical protein